MAAPVHLPPDWTAEDQLIIESLLLSTSPKAVATPMARGLALGMAPEPEPESAPALRMSVAVADAIQTAQRWRLLPAGVKHVDSSAAAGVELQQLLLRRSIQHRQQAESARRVRHREVQRRFMQRKKEQTRRVKQELERMEKEHDVLRLAAEEKKLTESNRTLQQEVETKEPVPFPTREQVQTILEDQLELIRRHYEPLTHDEWDDMTARNLREMEAAGAEADYESTGAVVLGWSDKRKVDYESGVTKFVLSKAFPQLDALAFRDRTWDKLLLEETHQRLFHAAVSIRTQVLQRVDDNGVVMHRVMFNPVTGGVVHAIEASMRVRYGRELLLFQRTLDHNAAFECVPTSHNWMQLMTSLIFSPAPRHEAGGCVFRYAGILKGLAPVDVKFWLMEMLWVILRFESVMVAPLFSLTSA